MESITQYPYKLPDKRILNFNISDNVFRPTATSDFIIKACSGNIPKAGSLLDLGCGMGIVGFALNSMGCVADLFASDLCKNAVELCKKNARELSIDVDIRCGNIFSPWNNHTFDYIVDDISGVAEDIARKSPWFQNIPCNSGVDGTDLTIKVIQESKTFLNPEGILFFPVVSLSAVHKIIDAAKANFNNVKRISSNKWFLPDSLFEGAAILLNELKDKKFVEFEEKFGKIICYTDIYIAFD